MDDSLTNGGKKRKLRTLDQFVFEYNEEAVASVEPKKGQTHVIIDILRENPGPWTTRDFAKFISEHPKIHTSSEPYRIVNVVIWRLKKVGLIKWIKRND